MAEHSELHAFVGHENPSIVGYAAASGGSHQLGDVCDPHAVAAFAREREIEIAMVSADEPLAAGVVDALLAQGTRAVGPTAAGAEIEWNKAFEKIGFKDAIAVRWQHERDDFEPEDINYCTLRWITTGSTFAMSALRSNPMTGEMIDAAEATHNPGVISLALYAHENAFRDADPVASLDALRRGLVIAQDSGNRTTESLLAVSLCRLEAVYGDPLAALDYITLAIRTFHDSGNTASVHGSVSILAAVFDRLGRYEPAATMAGFAVIPYTAMLAEFNTLIAHLRDVLGDQTYESLARKGETMTTAAMATYAYDQIDQARAELNAVSK